MFDKFQTVSLSSSTSSLSNSLLGSIEFQFILNKFCNVLLEQFDVFCFVVFFINYTLSVFAGHNNNKFLTPQKFALDIEKIVVDEQLNYIDAIIHYCEINNIEVESVTKLISKPLKERLKWDAIRLNFMKKTSRAKLPL